MDCWTAKAAAGVIRSSHSPMTADTAAVNVRKYGTTIVDDRNRDRGGAAAHHGADGEGEHGGHGDQRRRAGLVRSAAVPT